MCQSFLSYKKLNSFERWQVSLSILTLVAAISIGWQQNQINQNLLDLNYQPSIIITYIPPKTNTVISNPEIGRWYISNFGKENISIENVILRANNIPSMVRDDKVFFLNGPGKLVAPGNSEYFFAVAADMTIEEYRKNTIDGAGIPLEVHFKSVGGRKYIAQCLFSITIRNNEIKTNTSIISINSSDS